MAGRMGSGMKSGDIGSSWVPDAPFMFCKSAWMCAGLGGWGGCGTTWAVPGSGGGTQAMKRWEQEAARASDAEKGCGQRC